MGLLDKLFGFTKIRYVYGGSSSRSAPFSQEAYEQEVVRAVIDCIATHAAKAEALHVIMDKDGRVRKSSAVRHMQAAEPKAKPNHDGL